MIQSGADLTKLNEGCRYTAYRDNSPAGVWTIGYGHTGPEVKEGMIWTQKQCEDQFAIDYDQACRYAANDLGQQEWGVLGDERRAVLADIAFETGDSGLRKFKHLLAAVKATQWDQAAAALRNSLLFQQVPNRENRNIAILLTGAWPQISSQPQES